MPSSANLALSGVAAGAVTGAAEGAAAAAGGSGGNENDALRRALGKLVRSKGFMWLAFSDKAAMYWSHAGESYDGWVSHVPPCKRGAQCNRDNTNLAQSQVPGKDLCMPCDHLESDMLVSNT